MQRAAVIKAIAPTITPIKGVIAIFKVQFINQHFQL
jgi:hypothetical protein